MLSRVLSGVAIGLSLGAVLAAGAVGPPAAEYSKHFDALSKLSVAVAQAMPPDHYNFRPHPDSMTFGELMSTSPRPTTNSAPV